MNAEIVIGCDSMAMVIGLLAKKRVVSSIPPEGKPLSLPFAKDFIRRTLSDNQIAVGLSF